LLVGDCLILLIVEADILVMQAGKIARVPAGQTIASAPDVYVATSVAEGGLLDMSTLSQPLSTSNTEDKAFALELEQVRYHSDASQACLAFVVISIVANIEYDPRLVECGICVSRIEHDPS
jgi:hypothetical protein